MRCLLLLKWLQQGKTRKNVRFRELACLSKTLDIIVDHPAKPKGELCVVLHVS